MNRQIKENLFSHPKSCENAKNRNHISLAQVAKETGCIRVFRSEDGELIAVISNERSDLFIELEFLPLEKWVSDEFSDREILTKQVYFEKQEVLNVDSSSFAYPGDWNYDYDNEVDQVMENLSDYFKSSQLCREEVSHG